MTNLPPSIIRADTGTCRYIEVRGAVGWPVQIAVQAEGQQYDTDGNFVQTRWIALDGNGYTIEPGDEVAVTEANVVPLVRVNWRKIPTLS